MTISDKQIEILLAEFMDGMNRAGEYSGAIDAQARRAAKRARISEDIVDRAIGRIGRRA